MRLTEILHWVNADPTPTTQWMRLHYSHFVPTASAETLKADNRKQLAQLKRRKKVRKIDFG